MPQRRKSRELALYCLYSLDFNPGDCRVRLRDIVGKSRNPEVMEFAAVLASGVRENRARLDEMIADYALHWSLGRVAHMERNILRIALFEIALMEPPTPVAVAINEAVELSRKYGDEESYRFVNGILDRARQELEAGKSSVPRKGS